MVLLSSCRLGPDVGGNGEGYGGIIPDQPILIAEWAKYFSSPVFNADYSLVSVDIPSQVELDYEVALIGGVRGLNVQNLNQKPGPLSWYFTKTLNGNKTILKSEYIYPATMDFADSYLFIGYTFSAQQLLGLHSYEVCVNGSQRVETIGEVSNRDPDPSNNCKLAQFEIVAQASVPNVDLAIGGIQGPATRALGSASELSPEVQVTVENRNVGSASLPYTMKTQQLIYDSGTDSYSPGPYLRSVVYRLGGEEESIHLVKGPAVGIGKSGLRVCLESGISEGYHTDPQPANNCSDVYFEIIP
jgi:hypothetical protein